MARVAATARDARRRHQDSCPLLLPESLWRQRRHPLTLPLGSRGSPLASLTLALVAPLTPATATAAAAAADDDGNSRALTRSQWVKGKRKREKSWRGTTTLHPLSSICSSISRGRDTMSSSCRSSRSLLLLLSITSSRGGGRRWRACSRARIPAQRFPSTWSGGTSSSGLSLSSSESRVRMQDSNCWCNNNTTQHNTLTHTHTRLQSV